MISLLLKNATANLIAGPIRFGLNLILVAALSPKDYGIMVVPMVVYSLSQLFVDMGFNSSLIQKAVKKSSHFSSVFFLNLMISSCIAMLFAICGPFLANIYNIPEIEPAMYVVSISLVIRSMSLTSEALLQIRQKFHQLIFLELGVYLISYTIAIIFAKREYGYISLLAFIFLSSLLYTVGIFWYGKFVPRLKEFKLNYVKLHWRFSKPLLLKSIISNFSSKVDEIILVNLVSVKSLGVYSKGKELSSYVGVFASKIFSRPLFVLLSSKSGRIKNWGPIFSLIVNNFMLSTFIVYFLYQLFGQAILSKLLGEEWSGLYNLIPLFILSVFIYIASVFTNYILLSMAMTKELLFSEFAHMFSKFSLAIFLLLYTIYFNRLEDGVLLKYFLLSQVVGYSLRFVMQSFYICNKVVFPFFKFILIPFVLMLVIYIVTDNYTFSTPWNVAGLVLSLTLVSALLSHNKNTFSRASLN